MIQDKVGNFLIETGHGAHLWVVERIGQEANVDHNVRLDGHAVLKAKREHVDIHKLLVGKLRKSHAQLVAQRRGAQAARVDDHIGSVTHALQLQALTLNRVGRGLPRLGNGVAAAVFAVATDQHLVRSLEKHDVAAHLAILERGDGIEQLIEQALATQVAGDGEMPAHARIDADEFGELGNQTRRQVIDAKIAHVLEHVHGLRAARTGHSGDDDDIGDALRALRRIHGISLLHVLPPKNKRGTQQPGSRAVNCL